jgi:hypothetical protein
MPWPVVKKGQSLNDYLPGCCEVEFPRMKRRNPDKSDKKVRDMCVAACASHYRKQTAKRRK